MVNGTGVSSYHLNPLHFCHLALWRQLPVPSWTFWRASLDRFLPDEFPEPSRSIEEQLSFGTASSSFCPFGTSSLVIFSLSSPHHQDALKRGKLSNRISKSYNSVPSNARLWLVNNPEHSDSRKLSLTSLISQWEKDCSGTVIVEEVKASDDIGRCPFSCLTIRPSHLLTELVTHSLFTSWLHVFQIASLQMISL